jgi:nucleotide-binding universal stress UspA family protein
MSLTERTIIVGVDYSDQSIPAIDEALLLAARFPGTRIVPVLALPGEPITQPGDAVALSAELVERSRENLALLMQSRVRALGLEPPRVEPVVDFGSAAAVLIRQAEEQNAGMIVVGTHGRRGISHLVLGSVAEEVVRKAICSVLVARIHPKAAAAEASQGGPARASSEDVRTIEDAGPDLEEGDLEQATPEDAVVLNEPHLDGGRVVAQVLDVQTGQVFTCTFDDRETVRVEPLERDWVPQPSSAARARAARAGAEEAARQGELLRSLLDELGRERRLSAR